LREEACLSKYEVALLSFWRLVNDDNIFDIDLYNNMEL